MKKRILMSVMGIMFSLPVIFSQNNNFVDKVKTIIQKMETLKIYYQGDIYDGYEIHPDNLYNLQYVVDTANYELIVIEYYFLPTETGRECNAVSRLEFRYNKTQKTYSFSGIMYSIEYTTACPIEPIIVAKKIGELCDLLIDNLDGVLADRLN